MTNAISVAAAAIESVVAPPLHQPRQLVAAERVGAERMGKGWRVEHRMRVQGERV